MEKHVNLDELDIMLATEASERWGYNKNYVRREYNTHPEYFLKGSIRLFGTAYIITREGMEHLTGMTEDEATKWVVWCEKDTEIDFYRGCTSEIKCRNFLSTLYSEAVKQEDVTIHFSSEGGQITSINIPGKGRYYYAKRKIFKKRKLRIEKEGVAVMNKRIVDVKIESEHDMPHGKSELILAKLKEFIGEDYDIKQLNRAIQKFGQQEDVLGIGGGYQYSAMPEKDGIGGFRVFAMYGNVHYRIELEDAV
ncbi:helix-turn-helix domain-containing protein [Enterococcus sp. BWR-S5]|uniref:helix-turn-helix domain-containing protein n=1 Tax=Enterococcus sp. BWR-S5 TaxID=2787714 RepID=UPI0019238AB1|nr:helix-turn-helix domain-containing protein [Enterococcus sp. BWR-S5]MBL1226834.1 hypothetical protein [Enterococcus sp. BWR-S5]